jgi:hypothetical protein
MHLVCCILHSIVHLQSSPRNYIKVFDKWIFHHCRSSCSDRWCFLVQTVIVVYYLCLLLDVTLLARIELQQTVDANRAMTRNIIHG